MKESHITFHTYIEDILDNFLVVRLEFHISSCSESNVFESLDDIISTNNKDKVFPNLFTVDYLKRGSKYGENSNIIINESFDIFDINIDSNYDIFSNEVSQHTKSSLLLLNEEAMFDKYQSENSFMSSEMIVALRKFLLKSFAEEYQIAGSVDVSSV